MFNGASPEIDLFLSFEDKVGGARWFMAVAAAIAEADKLDAEVVGSDGSKKP